jgi:hypothetical protein
MDLRGEIEDRSCLGLAVAVFRFLIMRWKVSGYGIARRRSVDSVENDGLKESARLAVANFLGLSSLDAPAAFCPGDGPA